MIPILNQMSISIVAMKHKRPIRNLIQKRSRILGQRMEGDAVNGYDHDLHQDEGLRQLSLCQFRCCSSLSGSDWGKGFMSIVSDGERLT